MVEIGEKSPLLPASTIIVNHYKKSSSIFSRCGFYVIALLAIVGILGLWNSSHCHRHVNLAGYPRNDKLRQLQNGTFDFKKKDVGILAVQGDGPIEIQLNISALQKHEYPPELHDSIVVTYIVNATENVDCCPATIRWHSFGGYASVVIQGLNRSHSDGTDRVVVGVNIFLPENMDPGSLDLDIRGTNFVFRVNLPAQFMGVSNFFSDLENSDVLIPHLHVKNATFLGHNGNVQAKLFTERNITINRQNGNVHVDAEFVDAQNSTMIHQGLYVTTQNGNLQVRCASYDALDVRSQNGNTNIDAFPKASLTLTNVTSQFGFVNMNVHGFVGAFDASIKMGSIKVTGENVRFDSTKTGRFHKVGTVGLDRIPPNEPVSKVQTASSFGGVSIDFPSE